MDFTCADCDRIPPQSFAKLVEEVGEELNGQAWWLPESPWNEAQAEVLITISQAFGACVRHSSLLAAMTLTAWRRRALESHGTMPGMVSVITRELSDLPWDALGNLAQVEGIARNLRDLLLGTSVGGLVEVDRTRLRIRCTCMVAEGQGVTRTRLSLRRLRAWRSGVPDAAVRAKG